QIKEDAGDLRLGLRRDHAGCRPRRFMAKAGALEHDDLRTFAREPPGDRCADYSTADNDDFHFFHRLTLFTRRSSYLLLAESLKLCEASERNQNSVLLDKFLQPHAERSYARKVRVRDNII